MGCTCSHNPCPQRDTPVQEVKAPARRVGSRAHEWQAPSPIGDELDGRALQRNAVAAASPDLDCAQLIAWKSHDEQYYVSQSISPSASRRLAAAPPGTALLGQRSGNFASPLPRAAVAASRRVATLHSVQEGVADSASRQQSLPPHAFSPQHRQAPRLAPVVAITMDDCERAALGSCFSTSEGESRASSGASLGRAVSGSSFEFGRGVSTGSLVMPDLPRSPVPGAVEGGSDTGAGVAAASGAGPRPAKKPHRWITATMWEVPAEAIKATSLLSKSSRGAPPLSGTVAGATASSSSSVIERFEMSQALHAVRFRRTAPSEAERRQLSTGTSSVVATPVSITTPAGARSVKPDVWLAMGISEDAFTAGGAGSEVPSGVLYARGLSRMASYPDGYFGVPLTSEAEPGSYPDTSPETPGVALAQPPGARELLGSGGGAGAAGGAWAAGLGAGSMPGAAMDAGAGVNIVNGQRAPSEARGPPGATSASMFLGGGMTSFNAPDVDPIMALAPQPVHGSPVGLPYQAFSLMPPRSQSAYDVRRANRGLSIDVNRRPAPATGGMQLPSPVGKAPVPQPSPSPGAYAHSSATLDWVIHAGSGDGEEGGAAGSAAAGQPALAPHAEAAEAPAELEASSVADAPAAAAARSVVRSARASGLPPARARTDRPTAAPVLGTGARRSARAMPAPLPSPVSPASCCTATTTTSVLTTSAVLTSGVTRASSTMTTAEVSAPSPAVDWGVSPSQFSSPSPHGGHMLDFADQSGTGRSTLDDQRASSSRRGVAGTSALGGVAVAHATRSVSSKSALSPLHHAAAMAGPDVSDVPDGGSSDAAGAGAGTSRSAGRDADPTRQASAARMGGGARAVNVAVARSSGVDCRAPSPPHTPDRARAPATQLQASPEPSPPRAP